MQNHGTIINRDNESSFNIPKCKWKFLIHELKELYQLKLYKNFMKSSLNKTKKDYQFVQAIGVVTNMNGSFKYTYK